LEVGPVPTANVAESRRGVVSLSERHTMGLLRKSVKFGTLGLAPIHANSKKARTAKASERTARAAKKQERLQKSATKAMQEQVRLQKQALELETMQAEIPTVETPTKPVEMSQATLSKKEVRSAVRTLATAETFLRRFEAGEIDGEGRRLSPRGRQDPTSRAEDEALAAVVRAQVETAKQDLREIQGQGQGSNVVGPQWLSVKAAEFRIAADGQSIMIWKRLGPGLRAGEAETRIPVADVSAVRFQPSTKWKKGIMTFVLRGVDPPLEGAVAAYKDVNTVLFQPGHLSKMVAIKDHVEYCISRQRVAMGKDVDTIGARPSLESLPLSPSLPPPSIVSSKSSLAAELERLAALHRDGALSDGEFRTAKRRLIEPSGSPG
jgi:hypothetical protein